MHTLYKRVIFTSTVVGAALAAAFALRDPVPRDIGVQPALAPQPSAPLFSGRDDLSRGPPIGHAAGPAWKPPAEYPAFENLRRRLRHSASDDARA